MKKFAALLLVAVVLTLPTVFAACGKTHSAEPELGVNLAADAEVSATDNGGEAYKAADGGDSSWTAKTPGAELVLDFSSPVTFNAAVIREPSDSVIKFTIYVKNGDSWESVYTQDRIDRYRLCVFERTTSSAVKIVFDDFDEKVEIEDVEIYDLMVERDSFVRQAYLSVNTIDGETEIEANKDNPDYIAMLNNLTDVILFTAVSANTDGEIVCGYGIDKVARDIATIKRVTNGKVNVTVDIGLGLVPGDFNGNNRAMVKFARNTLPVFKENLKEFLEITGADGIDYDWEYPQLAWEWSAYNKLILATREVLGEEKQLSVALWPYGVNFSDEAMAAIDTVNGMAYDQFDERGNHSSPYECGLWAINYFMDCGFSREQILLGIPFYGRTTDEAAQWPVYNESYGKFGNFTPEYTYTDSEGEHTSSIYLNGYAQVRDKTVLAAAMDIGGIMIYELGCDMPYSYEYSLIKAVEDSVRNYMA